MTDPLDASERARLLTARQLAQSSLQARENMAAEQIRQAEQAARKKALEEIQHKVDSLSARDDDNFPSDYWKAGRDEAFDEVIDLVRALSEET